MVQIVWGKIHWCECYGGIVIGASAMVEMLPGGNFFGANYTGANRFGGKNYGANYLVEKNGANFLRWKKMWCKIHWWRSLWWKLQWCKKPLVEFTYGGKNSGANENGAKAHWWKKTGANALVEKSMVQKYGNQHFYVL